MRRFPIQIDDKTYDELRLRAFREKRSMASIVRECLEKSVVRPALTMKDFPFVGAGKSKGKREAIGRNHDDALADAIESRWRRK